MYAHNVDLYTMYIHLFSTEELLFGLENTKVVYCWFQCDLSNSQSCKTPGHKFFVKMRLCQRKAKL